MCNSSKPNLKQHSAIILISVLSFPFSNYQCVDRGCFGRRDLHCFSNIHPILQGTLKYFIGIHWLVSWIVSIIFSKKYTMEWSAAGWKSIKAASKGSAGLWRKERIGLACGGERTELWMAFPYVCRCTLWTHPPAVTHTQGALPGSYRYIHRRAGKLVFQHTFSLSWFSAFSLLLL